MPFTTAARPFLATPLVALLLVILPLLLSFASSAEGTDSRVMVPIRLQLQLDHKPHETAWEIRGPLPRINLVASAPYADYVGYADELIEEEVVLEQGETYYFLLTDFSEDGIHNGSFRILAGDDGDDTVVMEGRGDMIGSGKAYTIDIPKDCNSTIPTPRQEVVVETNREQGLLFRSLVR